ncbi:MAG: glycosyltransferase family 2 protein [Patescibacteria group bacterium]
MNELPKIGLIYLTYPTKNWQEDISRFLTSLQKISYPKERIELICVESRGDRPPIKPWFFENWMPKSANELPKISYIFSDERLGFATNNNLGYEKALELGCDYIELTNEDTDIDPDYLKYAVERAEKDNKIGIVQSLLLLGQDRDLVNSIGNSLHYLGFGYSRGYRWIKEHALNLLDRERMTNPELTIGYASGAAMLIRVQALKEVGFLFDEKFYSYHEDTDVSLQLKIRGWKIVLEPKSIVYHYYEFAKQKINYYWMERNRYVIIFSYYSDWMILILSPMIILMDFGILFFSILRGWSFMKLKVYADWFNWDYWDWITSRRKAIKTARKLSEQEFFQDTVSEIDFQEESVKNPLLKYIGNPLLGAYWFLVSKLIL